MRVRILAVSGHDPTGGAGIQADVEVAADFGLAASSLITALTVQSTSDALEVSPVPVELLRRAADTLAGEFEFTALKFGLLPSVQAVEFAAELAAGHPAAVRLADPVLTAGGGTPLADLKVASALVATLLPQLSFLTPNRSELAALSGTRDLHKGAEILLRSGVEQLLITGTDAGESESEIEHWLFGPDGCDSFRVPRIAGQFHGSGCTLATALTCLAAIGWPPRQAVRAALAYCERTLHRADRLGPNSAMPRRGDCRADGAIAGPVSVRPS